MRSQLIGAIAALGLILSVNPAFGTPSSDKRTALVLPPTAEENPVVVPLGKAVDAKSKKLVEGYAFIHYRDRTARSHTKGPKAATTKCYAYIANGAKWKVIEPWLMNPANIDGLDGTTLFNLQSAALAKWEDAADGTVGNGGSINIVGNGTSTSTSLVADTVAPDGKNEVYFGDIASPDAVGVTIVWGIFSGPRFMRELVEWDQIYDDVDFDWSAEAEGVAGKIDFDNVATHEDGHTVGMADIYDLVCSEQTMFGLVNFAETKKRTLETGDITGVNNLY